MMDPPVDFLAAAGRLKLARRTGWVNHRVPAPDRESVADHSWRMALMAILSADYLDGDGSRIDVQRAVLIAVVHDLSEAVCGDIVPGTMPAAEKKAREAAGLAQLLGKLRRAGGVRAADMIEQLYGEYEQQATPEAAFVKSADKVEMLLQALEYESAHPFLDLSAFFASTQPSAIKSPVVRAWAEEVHRRRAALLQDRRRTPLGWSARLQRTLQSPGLFAAGVGVGVALAGAALLLLHRVRS